MTVTCKICNKTFASLINNTHLKLHGLTTAEYKSEYGENSCVSEDYRNKRSLATSGENNPRYGKEKSPEERKKLSESKKGKKTWNAGLKLDGERLERARQSVRHREERYRSGDLERRSGWKHSVDAVLKIRESRSKQIISSESCEKAAKTRKANGYPGPMKGKNHSDETKTKISLSALSSPAVLKKKEETLLETNSRMEKMRLAVASVLPGRKLLVKCLSCGNEFVRMAQAYDQRNIDKGTGRCPACSPVSYRSAQEAELYEFVKSLAPSAVPNTRSVIGPMELDVFVPDKSLAVEYCGLYWHSEQAGKTPEYHREKLKLCREAGVRLITVFEDEWVKKRHLVESKISNALGLSDRRVGARECSLSAIQSREANHLLNKWHISGSGRSSVRYALSVGGEPVMVMTFSRKDMSRNREGWELNRMATAPGVNVPGGASKLFKAFVSDHAPSEVVCFSDLRWGEGGVYERVGFERLEDTGPGYWYVRGGDRVHRFTLRKGAVVDDDPRLTEFENRDRQGYLRVWDCGNAKYVWRQSWSLEL